MSKRLWLIALCLLLWLVVVLVGEPRRRELTRSELFGRYTVFDEAGFVRYR